MEDLATLRVRLQVSEQENQKLRGEIRMLRRLEARLRMIIEAVDNDNLEWLDSMAITYGEAPREG